MKKYIAIAACLLAGVATLSLFWGSGLSKPPRAGRVQIRLEGYTNDAAGARLAKFTVTNGAPVTVRRWGLARIDSNRQYTNASKASLAGGAVSLRPGHSETITLPVPTNHGPWKVSIYCSRDGWRRRWHELAGRWNSPSAPAWIHQGMRMEYSASSEWIDQ